MKSFFRRTMAALLSLSVLLFNCVTELPSVSAADASPNWNCGSYTSPRNPFAKANLYGQCTWYAWGRANELTGTSLPCSGNAQTWYSVAANNGYSVGSTPRVNAIIVWSKGTYGHVAYVESVSGNNVTFSESNWDKVTYNNISTLDEGIQYYSTRKTLTASQITSRYGTFLGYIYLSGGSTPTPTPDTVPTTYTQTVADGVYTFRNGSANTMMNVYSGTDANKTAVTTWTHDGSTDQRFRVEHVGGGKYYLYAISSSNGTNRVVDVYRGNSAPADGNMIDIYDKNDPDAQLVYIVPTGGGTYVFELASTKNYVIGATSTSNGAQLQLKAYQGSNSAYKWYFCDTGNNIIDPAVKTGVTVPTQTRATVNDGIYTIQNVSSGCMMNVYAGTDADYTHVTMWSRDGSTEQKFRVEQIGGGKYYLYPLCSSNGNNRVVDILRGSSYSDPLNDGDLVDICTKNDPEAQQFYIVPLGDGTYVFELASKDNLVIAATSTSTASTNGSVLQLKQYYADVFQKWRFCDLSGNATDASIKTLSSISVRTNPSKTVYYTGDAFDQSGLSVSANYDNGTSETVTSGLSVSVNLSTAGTKTATVTYQGKTASFSVTVKDKATLTAADSAGELGKTVETSVFFPTDAGVYSGNFTVVYDAAKLELVSASSGEALSGSVEINPTYATGKIRLSFAGTVKVSTGTSMLNLKFKLKGTSEGSTSISFESVNLYDSSSAAIPAVTEQGSITIYPSSVMAGDVTGENEVDLKDVTLLSRYVAGWTNLNVQASALDVSGDGKVDLVDVTLLSRFIAGWSVTLH